MYILNENTRKNIENKTGTPFEDIENMDFEDIDFNINKYHNKLFGIIKYKIVEVVHKLCYYILMKI